jgi:hypothetical protein
MPRRSIFANSDSKDTKSREQNKINLFIFYAETEYLRSALIAKIRIFFEKNTDVDGKLKKTMAPPCH